MLEEKVHFLNCSASSTPLTRNLSEKLKQRADGTFKPRAHSRLSVVGSLVEVHGVAEVTPLGSPVNGGMLRVYVKTPDSDRRRPQKRQHAEHKHPRGGKKVPHSALHPRTQRSAAAGTAPQLVPAKNKERRSERLPL